MAARTTTPSRTWPRQFLSDFERTGEALWLYLYLLTWRDPRTGYVRGSFRKTAARIGVSVVQIRRWLEQLEGEGYLKDESLDGRMIVKIKL
jgi:hypothetical protein